MRHVVVTALATPLLALATPVAAATIQINTTGPVVELTVTEIAKAAPDIAQVNAGVQVRAPTASEAIRLNAQLMDRVIAQLKAMGIAREDIQTANFAVNAQYQYTRDGAPPNFIGYDAANTVTVTLRNMDRIGEALDALVKAGANNVNGPALMLENDRAARATARKTAYDSARAQALAYANMAGFKNIRLLEISETYGQSPFPYAPMAAEIAVTAASKDVATPIVPGMVGTSATVTLKYEMTN